MSKNYDVILRGGTIVALGESGNLAVGGGDIGIIGEKIAAVGELGGADAAYVFDARGLHLLPGVIDSHVHFREPGGSDNQESFASGTRAAALGGVTTVFDMPNTNPPTVDAQSLAHKVAVAAAAAWCDFAFYIGATRQNTPLLPQLERLPGCCGVKLFMGSSTGSLLVDDDASIEQVLASGSSLVAVHAEDEPRLLQREAAYRRAGDVTSHSRWRDAEAAALAITRLTDLVKRTRRRVHVLHVSTDAELQRLAHAKRDCPITFEVTPHHLLLRAPQAYERHGTYAQVNPPLREQHDALGLWQALAGGAVDTMGSDHAPHSHAAKSAGYPASPSGFAGTQTMLPLMLDCVSRGKLTLPRLVELLCSNPARLYGIKGKGALAAGKDADIALVDLSARHTITNQEMASLCGWSVYADRAVQGVVRATMLRGQFSMREGELLSARGRVAAISKGVSDAG